ncbi:MAG TPA: tetratricopeptide repeat protein [Candidatus Binataceae bacterium]|nr:tetratricopeptide repeat protein [Candidatus Binataceae bacterium]
MALRTAGKFSLTAAIILVGGAATLAFCGCQHRSPEDYLDAGNAAMQSDRLADAEKNYLEAEKIAPDNAQVRIALGNLYLQEHKPGPAQLEYMKVIEIDPKNPAAHIALGNLYRDQQQFPLAEEQYRAALALDPSRSNYYLDLAGVLSRQGKPGAESEIRTAIGLDPKNAQAHLALARLLQADPNRATEAAAELDQVRALDPKLAAEMAAPAPSPPAGAAAASPPSAGPTPAPSAPAAGPSIKPLNKVFLLTRNSPVYKNPDTGSEIIGAVKSRKYVHVIGITGEYLQIKLRDGTVGFIPISAAE